MKKSLLLVLVLGLTMIFAACGNEPANDQVNTDDPDKAADPEAPISETLIEDAQEIKDTLGIAIARPEEYSATRYAIINDIQAQVEFMVGENQAIGRIAKGHQENMSEVTSTFDNNETVDVKGVSAYVRYPNPDSQALYSAQNIGVIDAYDETADVTYSVSILTNATKDDLIAALTALMEAATIGEAADSSAAAQ